MLDLCQVHNLGMVPYQQAWDLQNRLAAEIHAGARPPTLLLLEHPHTYTFGRSGDAKNLLWDETVLADKGIEVHWVDRGETLPTMDLASGRLPAAAFGETSIPTIQRCQPPAPG